MPWSKVDVERHSKGLTSHQQAVWVAVANRALEACKKNGGDDKTCAPKAIRQANAVAARAPKVKPATMAADIKTAIMHLKQAMAIHAKHLADPKKLPSQASAASEMEHIKAALTALGESSAGMSKGDHMAIKTIVELAATGEQQGASVVRRGKLFRAGDYPDKQFAMTADELALAVAAFQPVPLDSEHRESVFDGHLGEVEAIELCDNGASLCGAVRIPDWLDRLFPNMPIPVSTTWDRATKQLTGLALAKHPRVSDAAILAAFAQHNTWEGRGTLQGIHDMAARAGATCTPPTSTTGMNSAHENQGIQQIHDMATQHGARCSAMSDRYASYIDTFAAFAGRRNSGTDQAALDAAHEAIVKAGANCAGAKMSTTKERPMDKGFWSSFFSGLFGAASEVEISPEEIAAELSTTTTAATTDPALKLEMDTLKKQLAEQRRVQIETQAAAFADGTVRDRRALPAERQQLYESYLLAAEDDAAHGAVTFADGKQGTRVSRLETLTQARPQHDLTVEQVITNEAGALGNDATKAKMSEERHEALLAMTPLGQAVLERKRAKSA